MVTTKKHLTYAASGVKYDAFDYVKRLAQTKAQETAANLGAVQMKEIPASRGESAYVWQSGETFWALVVEGLGTKNLVADASRTPEKSYYDSIAQDTVAMIVNDLVVVGAKPLVVNAYFAVGSSDWFNDRQRAEDLVNGWAAACTLAGATWGGGETPTLKDIIVPTAIDLAGSCIGMIPSKKQLVLGDRLQAGDAIVLIESSGIHANGLTLARKIAESLPKGYRTKLSDGQPYGEALLAPTHIYARFVQDLFAAGLDLHYMVNITGHGWRKLMRANETFTYRVTAIPQPQPLFAFIQEQSGTDDTEMYGNFNMGAGFAVFLPAAQAKKVLQLASKNKLQAWIAGQVETGPKQVIIEPKNVTFAGESLQVR